MLPVMKRIGPLSGALLLACIAVTSCGSDDSAKLRLAATSAPARATPSDEVAVEIEIDAVAEDFQHSDTQSVLGNGEQPNDAQVVDVPPGAYLISAVVRPCGATCDELGEPIQTCEDRLRTFWKGRTSASVKVSDGKRCRIRLEGTGSPEVS